MPKGIPKGKKKLTDEELKANHKKSMDKYRKSEKGKATSSAFHKDYFQKPEVKKRKNINQKKYKQTEKGKATIYRYNFSRRMKVLGHYSKSLSNSDIPCCHCCGFNGHTDFLAIDHILGRTQMTSIPELVKIGYSSKDEGHNLIDWILENDFPKYFQILCHNCNTAKGYPRNNGKCPHETARKEETFAMMEEQSSFEV